MPDLGELFGQLSDEFYNLRKERLEVAVADFAFLQEDTITQMAEVLADTANYCEMQFIKLQLLQLQLTEQHRDQADDNGDIQIGLNSFRGSKDEWKRQ